MPSIRRKNLLKSTADAQRLYMGIIFKKSLSVYDTWFGFYGDFKKGTLHVHMNNAGVNGFNLIFKFKLNLYIYFWSMCVCLFVCLFVPFDL